MWLVMKKVWIYGLCCLLLIILVIHYFVHEEAEVIKYFPIDSINDFSSFETNLAFDSQEDEDEYEVTWLMSSLSDQTLYLRQDISLLYVNGRLKGVINKWQENTQKIEKSTTIHGEDTKKYEAISFHHGEIHKGKQPIKSIQATSGDRLYIIDSPHTQRSAFHKPSTKEERQWKKKLDHSIHQQIEAQWDELLLHYQIPESEYTTIPLTQLNQFENQPLPGVAPTESERIKGQLWEGLYKNYLLAITDTKSNHPIQSYIPMILFSKDGTHLMVLFEDDTGKKHQLIQYY